MKLHLFSKKETINYEYHILREWSTIMENEVVYYFSKQSQDSITITIHYNSVLKIAALHLFVF